MALQKLGRKNGSFLPFVKSIKALSKDKLHEWVQHLLELFY